MKSNLLGMSLEFLESSADYISKKNFSKSELKFSIVHLYTSVELLLKAELMDEHWSLLFRNMKDAKRQNLESGDFNSVTVDEAVQRLRDIGEKEIDDRVLKKLGKERNRIIHFNSIISYQHARALLLETHGFVIDYIADNDVFRTCTELEPQYDEIKRKISSLQQFIDKRLKTIKSELSNFEVVIKCPDCWQISVPLVEDDLQCRFCRTSFEREEFIYLYTNYFLSDYPTESEIRQCPECLTDGAVFAAEADKLVCLHCNTDLSHFSVCEDCNELMDGKKYDRICGDCIQERFDNDRMMPAPPFSGHGDTD